MYQRVSNSLHICKLKIYFSGGFSLLSLSLSEPGTDQKRFYETTALAAPDAEPYFGRGSFRATEAARPSRAGMRYTQSLIFKFPSNDPKRAQRIESFKKLKYIEMGMTDGSALVVGRNDVFQNTKPKVSFSSDLHFTEIRVESESIQPMLRITDAGGTTGGYNYLYEFILS